MGPEIVLLALAGFVPAILADRGSAPNVSPTACDTEPTVTPTAVTTSAPAPTCYHAADPDGALGLCPNLADAGWCECGDDNYPILAGTELCSYSVLPSTTLVLSTTNCVTSSTTVITTETVSPITSPTAAKREIIPTPPAIRGGSSAERLRKRAGTVTFSNCGTAPGGSWTGFTSKQDVLQKAYNDAVTLAKAAQNVASTNLGFGHYFGGTGTDTQLTHFQGMMTAIASDTNYYSIQFECQNTPSCGKNSVMVTDATPGTPTGVKTIEVCPLFWTTGSTKYLLPSSGTSPSPPYRPTGTELTDWCAKATNSDVSARNLQFFATAGNTVLHELTHVSSLAQQAGLSDEDGAYGTLDAQTGCELTGARAFLQAYIAGQTDGTSPDYNAESYAAAATEIYFMALCGYSQIAPSTS